MEVQWNNPKFHIPRTESNRQQQRVSVGRQMENTEYTKLRIGSGFGPLKKKKKEKPEDTRHFCVKHSA